MTTIDPAHWLYRYTPRQWLRASLSELAQARAAFGHHAGKGGLAGCRRAAGVALNGLLATQDSPDASYGRTYMDHLAGLAGDTTAPAVARDAARALLTVPPPGGKVVALRTPVSDARMLEAAETVMAHAYALVQRVPPAPEDE